MGRFVIQRLLQMIPVAIGLSVVVFVVIRAIPGDPAQVLAGVDASPEQIAAIRTKLGLDRSLPVQYFLWFGNVLKGDLGNSYAAHMPVSELILKRLPATLYLTAASLILALFLSFPLAIFSALREGSWLDTITTTITGIAISLPTFWLGLLFILAFSLAVNWLPPSGYTDPWRDPARFLRHLVLPALTLAVPLMAMFVRFIRVELIETLGEDYVRTGRAKGLSESFLALRHILPNAMVPVVTIIGLQVSRLLGGAIIVEIIFAWPGIGRLVIQAINDRDYATVQGVLLVLSALFVMVSLVTDLSIAAVDPRVRLAMKKR